MRATQHLFASFGTSFFRRYAYPLFITALLILLVGLRLAAHDAETRYQSQLSLVVTDRHTTPLSIAQNAKGHYAAALNEIPEDFAALLVKKEDQYFWYHPGINPISTARALVHRLRGERAGGASTITQQLAKNLLGTENERTVPNKLHELAYAFGLELFLSKEDILIRYANTVYLGNQVQGFETASRAYFEKPLGDTTPYEQTSLLATLSYPSTRNPWKDNTSYAAELYKHLELSGDYVAPLSTSAYSFRDTAYFELDTAGVACDASCSTTIDATLTETIRNIVDRRIDAEWHRGARNAAVVVIDPRSEEVLALVGSNDPRALTDGGQINMTLEPRPIGSTIKPFIYLKGFIEGLRPYSLVEDREYKYPIATGYSLYPKNYDGQYRGTVSLHEALSNSLNVPTVKVLEYIGLDAFYAFLGDTLRFSPIQDFDSYQYGIALGGLEMDLLTLTHYFTLFPRGGTLAPLRIMKNSSENFSLPPQSDIETTERIADEKYVELVHAILSDRFAGVEQFGLTSTLTLPTTGYGVKTGTSRDFHDSWVVGYTPDFVVGVWLGNVENQALEQLSGQSGAGAIWHEVMNLLLASPYARDATLATPHVIRIPFDGSDEWGLPDDTIEVARTLLLHDTLIVSPYNDDTFEYFSGMSIPLRAKTTVTWSANGEVIGEGERISFTPGRPGTYEISATERGTDRCEIISLIITSPE